MALSPQEFKNKRINWINQQAKAFSNVIDTYFVQEPMYAGLNNNIFFEIKNSIWKLEFSYNFRNWPQDTINLILEATKKAYINNGWKKVKILSKLEMDAANPNRMYRIHLSLEEKTKK